MDHIGILFAELIQICSFYHLFVMYFNTMVVFACELKYQFLLLKWQRDATVLRNSDTCICHEWRGICKLHPTWRKHPGRWKLEGLLDSFIWFTWCQYSLPLKFSKFFVSLLCVCVYIYMCVYVYTCDIWVCVWRSKINFAELDFLFIFHVCCMN